MPRDKKGKGRRGSSRFAAQSADEIEERNRRLEAFDQKRRDHRKAEGCSDDEDSGSDAEVADTSREDALAQMKMASMSVGGSAPKRRGLEGIIEVENPNAKSNRPVKLSDLAAKDPSKMTRKEREEQDKAAAAAAYRRRHELGLTEEYKKDMGKLEEVKKRRAASEAKKKAEIEDAEAMERERQDRERAMGEVKIRKEKKVSASGIIKLDKITIKKMKPAMMKEALKERGLEIQGNSKQLVERLLAYELGKK